MAENQERNDVTDLFTDESTVEWMEEHLSELKQSVSGPRLLYQSLVVGFVVGLAAHIGGYFLASSVPGGPLGLLVDLLLALGWSLWTGVVVAVFVEVIPEVKRRQIKRAVDAYEAMRLKQAQVAGMHGTAVLKKPHARRVEREQGQKRQRNRARKDG
jgi:F0F1-type ATP synthase assembly protein I